MTKMLPDPLHCLTFDGDIGAAVTAMIMINAKDERKAARAARDAASQAMENAEREQIHEMRNEAASRLASGLVSGGVTIGAAACSMVGASYTAKAAPLASSSTAAAQRGVDASAAAARAASLAQAATVCEAAGRASDGGGKVTSAVLDFSASRHAESAKAREMEADAAKRRADASKDDVDDAQTLIKHALDFYKEWCTGKNAAQSAALHRA